MICEFVLFTCLTTKENIYVTEEKKNNSSVHTYANGSPG